jgi:dTDP-4-dehydrorhamnose reductase
MEKTTLFVTGAAGLIGRELTLLAKDLPFDIFCAQHKGTPEIGRPIPFDATSELSIQKAIETCKPECVVHLAAITNVDKCEVDRESARIVNSMATEVIARETKKLGSHLIYMSTDYVFDGEKGRYTEDDEPNPVNWYGQTKLLGERAVEDNAGAWAIARTSTPFGIHPTKTTFANMVAKELSSGTLVQAVTDQYTSPTYTGNLVAMILEVARRRLEGTIHLATSTRISRYEFATLLAEKMGYDSKQILPVSCEGLGWVAKRPKDSSLDVGKASSLLDAKPLTVESSLDAFLARLGPELFPPGRANRSMAGGTRGARGA